jgi:hypothetical protein
MPSIIILPFRAWRNRNSARDRVDFPGESQYNVDLISKIQAHRHFAAVK